MLKISELLDAVKVLPQYLLPHHFISRMVFYATRIEFPPWKNLLINWFIKFYKVDMSIAAESEPQQYASFNHFFTRKLKPGARPVVDEEHALAAPVDGAISQIGMISGTEIFQVKGRTFTLDNLLAGDQDVARSFHNGHYATLYLAPHDYHRVHMPMTGRLIKMIYVPGRLFSVNDRSIRHIDLLFARNERIINFFNTRAGHMAVITVGAMCVGTMETVWAERVFPVTPREITHWDYQQAEQEISLRKGEEMGRFNMGSTVILLFESGRINWRTELSAGSLIKMGRGKWLCSTTELSNSLSVDY